MLSGVWCFHGSSVLRLEESETAPAHVVRCRGRQYFGRIKPFSRRIAKIKRFRAGSRGANHSLSRPDRPIVSINVFA
jgi:hypothetical protein